jgi:ADP-ribose pyrophosphatase YjhB (NUDIX family)
MEIENCFYRVSVKALVLNEAKDKFLICKKESGMWEFPGGGLDWGMTPQEDLPREILEEMGVKVNFIADHPSYFITFQTVTHGVWVANVLYETKLDSLSFIPSDECVEILFVNSEDIKELEVSPAVEKLAEMFKTELHFK